MPDPAPDSGPPDGGPLGNALSGGEETIIPSSLRGRVLAFDSGIGGLGIVAALRRRLPEARIDYLADTALFPYGEQPDDALRQHIVALLTGAIARLRPDVVVVACNTASTLALSALRETCPQTPFVGCVPAIRWAARLSRTRVIGLLATRATVRRPYVASLRERFAPDCTLLAHGARHLATYAEAMFRGQAVAPGLIAQELSGLFSQPESGRLDVVALGCTHYTFVVDALKEASPHPVIWLDPADPVARQTVAVLEAHAPSAGRHAAQDEGQLWYTALPPDLKLLEAPLRGFGYARAAQWEVQWEAQRAPHWASRQKDAS
jgi:glutamate racemase